MNAVPVHHVVSGRADGPVVVFSNSLGGPRSSPKLFNHFENQLEQP